jgi:chromate transporter
VIVTVIAYFYVKYRHMEGLQMVLNTLRPAVIALILTSGITILTQAFFQESHIDLQQINWIQGSIFIICMYLLLRKKKDPIIVMLFAGVLNVIGSFLMGI